MYALIEYGKTENGVTIKPIYSVKFSNNVIFSEAINPDASANRKFCTIRVTKENAALLRRLVNDVAHGTIKIDNELVPVVSYTNLGDTINTAACVDNSFARKLPQSSINSNVRPAAYRAGATSIFMNL